MVKYPGGGSRRMADQRGSGPTLTVETVDDVDLEGATVVDGFPSVGLVSTICANYLIDLLELDQVGLLDSPAFPTVSIVRDGEPMFPVRIYAGEGLCVFVSEFQPNENLVRGIAETILDFSREQGCSQVLSPEGLVGDEEPDEEAEEEVEVYGVGSTASTRERLTEAGLETFDNGIITGVSGVLLALGKQEALDTVSLLAEANPNYPDARAAAHVMEAVDALLDVDLEVKPLYTEAETIERTLRHMQKQAGQGDAGRSPSQHPMYG